MKFVFGHEVIDSIADIENGSIVSVLDENRYESILFLNALLSKNPVKSTIITPRAVKSSLPQELIDMGRLTTATEVNLLISKVRENLNNEGVIIHNYLHHLLLQEDESQILRMIEFWIEKISKSNIVEFIILPKGTFQFFERKLNNLVSGYIEINLKSEAKNRYSFKFFRICKPEFHGEEFLFTLEANKLLVKWGDEFTETLPKETEEEIRKKVEFLKNNLFGIVIDKIVGKTPEGMSTFERWLFSQVSGMPLSHLYYIYPDKIEEFLRKIAVWNLRGLVSVKLGYQKAPHQSTNLRLRNRIAMKIPTSVALIFLKKRGDTVPFEVYNMIRKASAFYVSTRTASEETEELEEIEYHFQEYAARETAVRTLLENKESPLTKFPLSDLPKVVSLSLYYGYRMKPRVYQQESGKWIIEIDDCFVCKYIRSDKPACALLLGTIIGGCAVTFKEKFVAKEVACKAKGDNTCRFLLALAGKSSEI
ncbi:MAG: V4R domain-containing protein [Candidatus Methanomethylicaceae archaeon]